MTHKNVTENNQNVRDLYFELLSTLRREWQQLGEPGREKLRDDIRTAAFEGLEVRYPIRVEDSLCRKHVVGETERMRILLQHLITYSDDELAMDLYQMRTRSPSSTEETLSIIRDTSEFMKVHGFVSEFRRVLRVIGFYTRFVDQLAAFTA